MSRRLRIALQVAVSGAVIGFLLWQIDLGRTVALIGSSDPLYLLAALAAFLVPTWWMAWRWQVLLASKGIHEPLGWLTKLYFVGYAATQVLPTAVGGDAVRIVEHSRRRPEARAEAAAAVLMERVLGAATTIVLVALALAVAAGRFGDLRLVLWIEAALVAGVAVALALLFSRRSGRHLRERVFPLGRRLRLERPLTSLYAAMHGYRARPGTLALVFGISVAAQLVRIVGMWLCGEAVGVEVSPLVYLVLGPLLFLVQMVPITINGIGVREAFFVAFLARFGVAYEAAFATGFLFYAVSIVTALPGGAILLWRSVRPAARPSLTGPDG